MIVLKVPYAEKDEAKALGARWNPTRKCWYVPEGKDAAPFARWVAEGGAAGTGVASVRVYELLTVQQNVGAAAAQSTVLAAVLIVLLSIYVILARRRGEKV